MKVKVLTLLDNFAEFELSDFTLINAPQIKEYWVIRLFFQGYYSFFEILESSPILSKRAFSIAELEDYKLKEELRALVRKYEPHHCRECGEKYRLLDNQKYSDGFCSDYCKNQYDNPPFEEEEELEVKEEEIIEVPVGRFRRILK